jgi:Ion transport protein
MAGQHAMKEEHINNWSQPISVLEAFTDDGSYNSQSAKYLLISERGIASYHQSEHHRDSYDATQLETQPKNNDFQSYNVSNHDLETQPQQHQIQLQNHRRNQQDMELPRDQMQLPVTLVDSNHYLSSSTTETMTENNARKLRHNNYIIEGIGVIDFLIWLKSVCGFLVNTARFKTLILMAIVANALCMGIETFPVISNYPQRVQLFQSIDLIFLILFTFELGMQIMYRGLRIFRDGWLTFDFFVILMSWLLAPLQIIRAFRVFRVLRLVTRLKALQDIVTALIDVIPRMIAIVGLMTIVYYVYAVMFTQLFGSAYDDGVTTVDYFSRLDKTWFSLFQLMTLDSWSTVTRQLMTAYPWAWLPIMSYILSTSFIVINLVIAVICDAISKIHCDNPVYINEEIEQNASFGVAKGTQDEIARLECKIDQLTSLVRALVTQDGNISDEPHGEMN